MAKGFKKVLYNGGELFVNQRGNWWDIDVFDADWEVGQDPIYHATYSTKEAAENDAASWKEWQDKETSGLNA